MSLYTPPSLIRKLILEAEELTLNPSPEAQSVQDSTAASSPADIAADMSAASAESAASSTGSALTMPNVAAPASTVNKTVINKDIVLSQLAELKSVIQNFEKKFDGDDLTPAQANVLISGLLSTLVFHAERFNAFMGSSPETENIGQDLPLTEPEITSQA